MVLPTMSLQHLKMNLDIDRSSAVSFDQLLRDIGRRGPGTANALAVRRKASWPALRLKSTLAMYQQSVIHPSSSSRAVTPFRAAASITCESPRPFLFDDAECETEDVCISSAADDNFSWEERHHHVNAG